LHPLEWQLASLHGQPETPNHVRGDGSFPRKRSPDAGDGCTADYCQPGLLLVAELARIADTEAGDPGICNITGRNRLRQKTHLVEPVSYSTKIAIGSPKQREGSRKRRREFIA
jgi:hypothetical protein